MDEVGPLSRHHQVTRAEAYIKPDKYFIDTVRSLLWDSSCPVANDFAGLQCHTAPFSWKVVFEYDHQLFELTMSACSLKEELEWRSRLTNRFGRDGVTAGEQAACASLSLEIRPMGAVFGKPGECNYRSLFRWTVFRSLKVLWSC
jgi:hypothetical protein